jgi:hypothetical protein
MISSYNFKICKKQKKYDRFLWLCVVIPQPPHDIFLKKPFKKGFKIKVKMAIISRRQKTLVEVAKSTIMIK